MKVFFSNFLLLALLSAGLSSCLTKEIPVPLKPKGDATTASVDLAEDYRWQIFYSLKNNTIVGSNLYTAWDMGFETSADGWHVVLNEAKFRMVAYRTNKKDLAAVTSADTIGVASMIDFPSGSFDSTAIGDWRNGDVYIIHRGTDELGAYLGMRKIQILSVDEKQYIVKFSEMNGANEKTMTIIKDAAYNFTFLSFDDGGKTLLIEPPKTEWDIVFTKYTHYYYDQDLRYSVVGCVLNRYQTAAGQDTLTKDFAAIDLQNAAPVKLSSFVNTIGFEWKTFDLNSGKYTVDANKFYILESSEGVYYKLRFIGFYNKAGVKGSPNWEFQRL